MMQLNRIVAVLEPHEIQQPALDRADGIVRRSRAKLELHCVDTDGAPAASGARDLDSWLEAVRGALATDGLDVTTVASYGRPHYRHVLEHVREIRPDLLVKATRFHARMERTYFTASDWRLITHSPVPLWLAKQAHLPEDGPVLAAIDPFHEDDKPAELDERILKWAATLSGLLERRLIVVHAVSPFAPLPVAGEAYLARIRDEAETLNRHIESVRDLVAPFGVAEKDLHVATGHADHVIGAAAGEHGAAIVVMGAVSRSSLKELFIGNTAERVLEEIDGDLLVVPMAPAGRATDSH